MLTASGHYEVTERFIKVVTDNDFCKYYRWLFCQENNDYGFSLPMYGAHIGIISESIHNKDCSDYLYLDGRETTFQYDIEGNYGGYLAGFLNFWLDVYSKEYSEIRREFGIPKEEGFCEFHMTIGNNKNRAKNTLTKLIKKLS